MNIVEAMKRSKESGERFERFLGVPTIRFIDHSFSYLTGSDIIADDWEPIPGTGGTGALKFGGVPAENPGEMPVVSGPLTFKEWREVMRARVAGETS